MKLIIILQNIKQKFSDILEYNSWNKKYKNDNISKKEIFLLI